MAGIGIELRKLLRKKTYAGVGQAYLDAALISSGPWLLSMMVVAFMGFPTWYGGHTLAGLHAFTVSVSHLVSISLVVTGFVQLLYTRFVADRLFENKDNLILPNLLGMLTAVNIVCGSLGLGAILLWFSGTSVLYRTLMLTGFVLLGNIWCLAAFLGGIKQYRMVLRCFALAYGLILLMVWPRIWEGVEALLGYFVIGQAVLVYSLLWVALRNYPSNTLVSWELADRTQTYRSLALTGFFYNLGLFIDKWLFWYYPTTSEPIIGPLRDSPSYDFPLFVAYLSMVPGLAVFMVRMETDFAERYDVYYDAIREGETFSHIERLRGSLIDTARHGIYEILKIQGTCIVLLLLFGPALLRLLHVPLPYLPLFDIDVVSVGVQVLLLAILNTLFYLDKLPAALLLCAVFATSNWILTWISLRLGADFYGFGYALSVTLTSIFGLGLLSRNMGRLTYETFMFQPGPLAADIEDPSAEGGGGRRRGGRRRPARAAVASPAASGG